MGMAVVVSVKSFERRMHTVCLNRGLVLDFLDEMTPPRETRSKGGEISTVGRPIDRVELVPPFADGLDDLANRHRAPRKMR
jgi:hypothetical protein